MVFGHAWEYDSGHANSTWNIVSGDETWVYESDPETKAQSSVWLFPGDTPPLKLKQSMSTSEQMVASYIAQTGYITAIPLEERRTVTADWYVHQCLPQVLHAVRTRRPKSGITLHHDNAPAHTTAATREFLASKGVQLMSHPPSPLFSGHGSMWLFLISTRQEAAAGDPLWQSSGPDPSLPRGYWQYR